ncbi:hypothetical protein N825_15250 [Skermanella stibiiresistens SB22]|uniref:Uncharacterized protein n=1 Tax=Skermanella stibiiresistens SB22 TaxID=1385369 RepID=W9H2T6_9PROT|nr:hypothetical protein [Skermanella stibiiresistens]EWY38078.1 hypothetical protein N825_15250 [Skermanella stibiiresistens SB22]
MIRPSAPARVTVVNGMASVTVQVPEAATAFIEKAAEFMRDGSDPAAALRRAGGSFDASAPPPSRDAALSDDDMARQRDQHQMAKLRNRLESQELRSAAELGQRVRNLRGWRLVLARMAGVVV